MPNTLVARQIYQRRVIPPDTKEVRALIAFLNKEHQQIQRSGPHINIKTLKADYLISGADEVLLFDTTLGALNVTLPMRVEEMLNLHVIVKNIGASNLTIIGTVDATVNLVLTQWQAATIASDAVAYYLVGRVV